MEVNYDNRLNKEDYVVVPVRLSIARKLVSQYHYAKSATNTGVYAHGLFKKEDKYNENKCLGVAWWLPPTKNAAIATYPEGDWRCVLSLTRLVIVPDTPKNACSFLLSQSVKMINKKYWHCLVTYADTWQNHSGTIYKACNWEYMGLTKPSPVFQNDDGKMMGRKRADKNFTLQEMTDLNFKSMGNFPKHKFRLIINKKPVPIPTFVPVYLF